MKHQQLLQHHQLKATPQRVAIIELMQHAGHISIDELYRDIREKFVSISLATLYKNIHSMTSVNLIREVKISGQKSKYEIEKASHAHIVCKECGELKDVAFDLAFFMQETIKTSDYITDEVSIVISGVCPKCQK
ncbi:MAG: Fur family transcriptional regulator [Sulfuricurvum sp.]